MGGYISYEKQSVDTMSDDKSILHQSGYYDNWQYFTNNYL